MEHYLFFGYNGGVRNNLASKTEKGMSKAAYNSLRNLYRPLVLRKKMKEWFTL